MESKYQLIHSDALEGVKGLPDASIDCVTSSPPYWQLRDYGYAEQWGLEPTFNEYLEKLWVLMDEVKRVLKPTGTAWINLGDTYFTDSPVRKQSLECFTDRSPLKASAGGLRRSAAKQNGIANKCLLMIPHRFAIGCSERGWLVRNDIVWAKRNGMPESVTDRFSKKHEYFFLMAKSAKYFFDLDSIRDVAVSADYKNPKRDYQNGLNGQNQQHRGGVHTHGKNPGDVADFWSGQQKPTLDEYLELCAKYYLEEPEFWDIPTRPSSAKHYATFNIELIDKPIKAGCPEGGTVLDMFCGTATTGVRALQLNRKFIGIDGSKEYLEIARTRIEQAINAQPLFAAA